MYVTPHVGVWIETYNYENNYQNKSVTPHVGVWIETKTTDRKTTK